MPVRLPPITENATRLLLESIVDYAGLFPPAGLSMSVAARNYANYRGTGAAWMLGRFVCPAHALALFSQHAEVLLPRDAGAIPWRLAVIGSDDVVADLRAIADFNDRHRVCFDEVGAVVDSYEARATSVSEIAQLHLALPAGLVTYVEIPLGDAAESLIAELARTGRRAKLRAGGVTLEAFPTPAQLVSALAACIAHDVTAKATAGLHHPTCGTYRLTYADDAPVGAMFGFLNLFLTAALLADGGAPSDAESLLQEHDATLFEVTDHSVAWRDGDTTHHFDRALLQRLREHVLVSFGSCSFTEPVNESRALAFL